MHRMSDSTVASVWLFILCFSSCLFSFSSPLLQLPALHLINVIMQIYVTDHRFFSVRFILHVNSARGVVVGAYCLYILRDNFKLKPRKENDVRDNFIANTLNGLIS